VGNSRVYFFLGEKTRHEEFAAENAETLFFSSFAFSEALLCALCGKKSSISCIRKVNAAALGGKACKAGRIPLF
jgi:hypothetical protein